MTQSYTTIFANNCQQRFEIQPSASNGDLKSKADTSMSAVTLLTLKEIIHK